MDLFSQVIGEGPSSAVNDILRESREEFQLSLSSEGLKLFSATKEKFNEVFNIADAKVVEKVKRELEDSFKRPRFGVVNNLQDLRTIPRCDTELVVANARANKLLNDGVIDGYSQNFDDERLERIRREVYSGVSVNGGHRRIVRGNSTITKDVQERRVIRYAWQVLEDELEAGNDGTSRHYGLL